MATRRESVRLSLEDAGFSTGMMRAAAATAVLDAKLDDLDGAIVGNTKSTKENTESTDESTQSRQRSKRSTEQLTLAQAIATERLNRHNKALRDQAKAAVDAETSTVVLTRDNDRLASSFDRTGSAIDRTSGRLAIYAKIFGTLGPALVPVGAVAVPAVTGLASQLGFAAIGMSSLIVASQGVGDAIQAVNKAALEPTAENLQAAREAMSHLAPEAQEFVAHLDKLRPVLGDIRDSAAAGWFPGLTEALGSFEDVAPRIADIFQVIGTTGGNLFADAAASLAGPEWSEFMAFIEREAPVAFSELGHTIGNLAHGMSELWMAFAPLNSDFSDWMLKASRSFDDWASGLSQTQGFEEFVAYVRENGPLVGEAMVAIANAVLQIAEAAAPLGGPVLKALTGIAEAIGAIADSPLGTPIAAAVTAMSALSLATNAATAATLRLKAAQSSLGMGPGAAGAAGAGGSKSVLGGNLVTLAGLEGALMATHLTDNFIQVLQGDRGWREAGDVVATWSNPFTAGLKTIGIDVYGTRQPFLKAAVAASQYAEQVDTAATSNRRLSGALFRTERQQVQNIRQSERLKEAIKEQNTEIRESAASWGDYSQKVQLGKVGIDDLMRRWRKLGAAAQDMGENINAALERGVDPRIIRDIIRRLGPQGAAGAIEDLSTMSKREIREMEAAFGQLAGGTKGYKSALTDLQEQITHLRQRLRELNNQTTKPKIDADISGLEGGVASAERLLTGLNGTSAHTYVYTHHITTRTENSSPGFGPTGSADGGTVPKTGKPYADRHPYLLADGEEVISNRWGQADRHRSLLKAINAGRLADGGTARRWGRSAPSGGSGTVRHVVEVKVVGGELDLSKAKAQIHGIAREISRDEISQERHFEGTQG